MLIKNEKLCNIFFSTNVNYQRIKQQIRPIKIYAMIFFKILKRLQSRFDRDF
jgi:hypothetical protein